MTKAKLFRTGAVRPSASLLNFDLTGAKLIFGATP